MTIAQRRQLPPETYTKEEVAAYRAAYRAYLQYRKSNWAQKPYNEFLSLVTQRLAPQLDPKKPFCPFCQATAVTVTEGSCTCLGSFNELYDPNHHWDHVHCQACGKRWTLEYKGLNPVAGQTAPRYNAWCTQHDPETGLPRLILGLPTCFEAYLYTCRHCGGTVQRHYYATGTRNEVQGLCYVGGKPQFDTAFRCHGCGTEVPCSDDRYVFSSPHAPHPPSRPRLRWPPIRITLGPVIGNTAAMERIQFE